MRLNWSLKLEEGRKNLNAVKSVNKKSDSKIKVFKKVGSIEKEEETEIQIDFVATKANSSVIADAAKDSEPDVPVQFSEVIHKRK